ncbi:MAG: hypothetical protein ABL308_08205 [Oceanicaulis sp.]
MIRFATIVAGLVAAALVAALYLAQAGASEDRAELARLEAAIADEKERIKALDAQIAYQEDPENLRRLARIYLGFEPVRTDQEIAFSRLPRMDAEEPGAREEGGVLSAARVSYPVSGGRP